MNAIDKFVTLMRDEMGLPVTTENVAGRLSDIPGWDSMRIIELLVLLERETGNELPLARMIEAQSLQEIYDLARAA